VPLRVSVACTAAEFYYYEQHYMLLLRKTLHVGATVGMHTECIRASAVLLALYTTCKATAVMLVLPLHYSPYCSCTYSTNAPVLQTYACAIGTVVSAVGVQQLVRVRKASSQLQSVALRRVVNTLLVSHSTSHLHSLL
jgi:hypothetical protein